MWHYLFILQIKSFNFKILNKLLTMLKNQSKIKENDKLTSGTK